MLMRPGIIAIFAYSLTASPILADDVLYCSDRDSVGFKWDRSGQASKASFALSRFTVRIGPAPSRSSSSFAQPIAPDEREVVETTDGPDKGIPIVYRCAKVGDDKVVCTFPEHGTTPWMFAANGHYVRAFLAGGPASSGLDPNIAIAYGTCTRF
jgi:hypothetical protein